MTAVRVERAASKLLRVSSGNWAGLEEVCAKGRELELIEHGLKKRIHKARFHTVWQENQLWQTSYER